MVWRQQGFRWPWLPSVFMWQTVLRRMSSVMKHVFTGAQSIKPERNSSHLWWWGAPQLSKIMWLNPLHAGFFIITSKSWRCFFIYLNAYYCCTSKFTSPHWLEHSLNLFRKYWKISSLLFHNGSLILDSQPGRIHTDAGVAWVSFAVGLSGFRKHGLLDNVRSGRKIFLEGVASTRGCACSLK